MAIELIGNAALVLCFDFQGDGSGSRSVTEEDESRARLLACDLRDTWIRQLLIRTWIQQFHQDIHAAGLSPYQLRQRAAEVLAEFQEALKKNGYPEPDALEIELVDRRREVVHTLHGTDLPIGFEDVASHRLDSPDIQAFVVRELRPEIIVGNDPERFDQWIFERLHHSDRRRLWIPLVPFHASIPSSAPWRLLGGEIRRRLTWEYGKTISGKLLCRQARWIEAPPPTGSAYGTLSVSFRRRPDLDLAPWTDDLAYFCVQKAWELGEQLFLATLPGALERIGQLAFSLGAAKSMRLICAGPQPGKEELRNYPAQDSWRIARPLLQNSEVTFSGEPERLEYGDEVVDTSSNQDIVKLREETKALAIRSMRWASRLYAQEMEAFELHDTARHGRVLLGTEVTDPVVSKICDDACREAGAVSARFYAFDYPCGTEETPPPELKDPVTDSSQPGHSESDLGTERAQAESLARRRTPIPAYLPGKDRVAPARALLPFELADWTRGVFALSFPDARQFKSSQRRDLERRASRWVQRLSMHRLILASRFSGVVARLRKAVVDAKDSPSLDAFLESFLKASVDSFGASGGLVSFHSAPIQPASPEQASVEGNRPEAGPSRMVRLLVWRESREPPEGSPKDARPALARYEAVGAELAGPCRVATDKNQIVSWDTREAPKFEDHVGWLSQQFAAQDRPECQAAAEWLAGLTGPASALTIPIPLRSSRVRHRLALSIFLPQIHALRQAHVEQLTDFAGYLGGALASTRDDRQRSIRDRHERCVAERCTSFADKDEQDAIVGVLLAGLGTGANDAAKPDTPPVKRYAESWGLADHAVLWAVGQDPQEVVARGGRGVGFEIVKSRPVRPRGEHPWFQNHPLSTPSPRGQPWEELKTGLRLSSCKLSDCTGKYCSDARRVTGHDWMVSFPLVDAQSRFFGLVDLFRSEPFEPDEHGVIEDQLRRLSSEFCSAVERSRSRRVRKFALDLHTRTADLLQVYKTEAVHRTVAEALSKHLDCADCDLFLLESDQLVLVATTRQTALVTHTQRWTLTVSDGKDDPLAEAMASKRPILQRGRGHRVKPDSLSPALTNLLGKSLAGERLIAPIMDAAGDSNSLVGVFQLSGKVQLNRNRSSSFSAEDIVEARAVAGCLEPILRLVRVIDEHGLHVNELVHGLGQPLQRLRNDQYLLKRMFVQGAEPALGGSPQAGLEEARQNLDEDFKDVEEVRDRLNFLACRYRPDALLTFERVALAGEIQDAVRAAQRHAVNVTFHTDLGNVRPVPVERAWMRQALTNLLDNAGKYSYRGRVVEILLSEANDEILVEIENYGIGIPPQDMKRIFRPFYRSTVPDKRGIRPGTGLGLTIVWQAIVEIHCGGVDVKSSSVARLSEVTESPEAIENVPHLTRFTVRLSRHKLENLAQQHGNRKDSTSG